MRVEPQPSPHVVRAELQTPCRSVRAHTSRVTVTTHSVQQRASRSTLRVLLLPLFWSGKLTIKYRIPDPSTHQSNGDQSNGSNGVRRLVQASCLLAVVGSPIRGLWGHLLKVSMYLGWGCCWNQDALVFTFYRRLLSVCCLDSIVLLCFCKFCFVFVLVPVFDFGRYGIYS